jgi:hypothetical protein
MGTLYARVGGAWVAVGAGATSAPPVPPGQVGPAPTTPTTGMLWWDTADTSLDVGIDIDGGTPASAGTDTVDCGSP